MKYIVTAISSDVRGDKRAEVTCTGICDINFLYQLVYLKQKTGVNTIEYMN